MARLYIMNSNHTPTPLLTSAPPSDWSYATKELLDTLPQVWTRGLLYFLILFAAIALPWAMLTEVEETGSARGRLEPKEPTVKLESSVGGTIINLPVTEGNRVKTGQTLLTLESDIVRSEIEQLRSQLDGQKNRLNQLAVLKNQLDIALHTQQRQNQSQELEKQSKIEQARQNFNALESTYTLEKAEKLAQVNQAKQAIASSQAAYNQAQVNLIEAKDKVQRYRKAFEAGAISTDRFTESQNLVKVNTERLVQAESDISQAQLRLKEQQGSYDRILHQTQAEIDQAKLRLQEQQKSYDTLVHSGKLAVLKIQEQLKNIDTQITTLQTEIKQSESQIAAKDIELKQRVFKAPESGTVFGLPDKGVGAVVQPGELIAEIAPQGSTLILKAQMPTAESGALQEGMEVKLKFDAYPFQDYGVVEGKLIRKSPTSKVTETAQGQVTNFELKIELNQSCISTKSQCLELKPGDTATAEVIVRRRKIIDFILDPFKKLQKGGLELWRSFARSFVVGALAP